jgi:nucleotide-binding universal stress UspA family protein
VATFAYVRPPIPPLARHYRQAIDAQLRTARATLDEAAARATALGVESESELLEGDPADQLLELARLRGAGLIVVGSRGLGAMTGALLGSVSYAVARGADRPVLVVKHGTDD